MTSKNSRWKKGNIRYDKAAIIEIAKFNERKGFRNAARVANSPTVGEQSNG